VRHWTPPASEDIQFLLLARPIPRKSADPIRTDGKIVHQTWRGTSGTTFGIKFKGDSLRSQIL
jgi:hypothetical protein